MGIVGIVGMCVKSPTSGDMGKFAEHRHEPHDPHAAPSGSTCLPARVAASSPAYGPSVRCLCPISGLIWPNRPQRETRRVSFGCPMAKYWPKNADFDRADEARWMPDSKVLGLFREFGGAR
jgi:hypothetical protein